MIKLMPHRVFLPPDEDACYFVVLLFLPSFLSSPGEPHKRTIGVEQLPRALPQGGLVSANEDDLLVQPVCLVFSCLGLRLVG